MGLLHAASNNMQGADDQLVQARLGLDHFMSKAAGLVQQAAAAERQRQYADACLCMQVWHLATACMHSHKGPEPHAFLGWLVSEVTCDSFDLNSL